LIRVTRILPNTAPLRGIFDVHLTPDKVRRDHGGGCEARRVFRQFAWLQAGSGKMALPRPAHQRATPAVSQPLQNGEICQQNR